MRVCTALTVAVLGLVVGVLPATAQTATTALFVDSQPGDYVGQGVRRTWTPADVVFSGSLSNDRSSVTISAIGANGTHWRLQFGAPLNTPLTPGTYEHAIAWRSNPLSFLAVSDYLRNCPTGVGRFHVYEISVSPSGVLERFAADFEQHCGFATPALFGAVRYQSQQTSLEPFDGAYPVFSIDIDPVVNGYVSGPGIDCGADRTDCDETFADATSIALQAIPNDGYVFVGWAGFDCVGVDAVVVLVNRRKSCRPVFGVEPGGSAVESPSYAGNAAYLDMYGRTHEVTPVGGRSQLVAAPPYAHVTPTTASPSEVTFSIDHDGIATAGVTFGAPPGEVLEPGVYEPAGILFTLHTPSFTTSGPDALFQLVLRGRPCETSGARFQIHDIRFSGETLAVFAADFDVRCTWSERVTGSIRYNSSRDTLIPFNGTYPTSTLHVAATAGGYVTGSGISCGDGGRTDCEATSPTPGVFGLQAVPSPGYDFFGWTGQCSGSAPFATVSVSVVDRCVAVFQPSLGSPVALPPLGSGSLVIVRPESQQQPALSIWVAPDARIVAQALAGSRSLQFRAESLRGTQVVSFSVPSGQISVGTYVTTGESAGSSLSPALSADCVPTRGSFTVYEATYAPDGTPLTFAADFEMYCGPPQQYMAGALRYRSSRHDLRPFGGVYPVVQLSIAASSYGSVMGPGLLCGDRGTDCIETYTTSGMRVLQAIPRAGYQFIGWLGDCSGGSYTIVLVDQARACEPLFRSLRTDLPDDPRFARGAVMIESPPGDPVGDGVRRLFLTDAWSIFSSSRRSLTATAWGTDWRFEFLVPAGQTLAVKSYEGAVGINFASPFPSLSVHRSFTCLPSETSGRFVVHELSYTSPTSSTVASFAIDFELRCRTAPPLRGAIRYRSNRSEIRPFAGVTPRIPTRFDFNGDQNVDLVWQNRSDGRLLFWYLNGSSHVFNELASPLPQVPDTNWHIVGNADANGDGYTDLYWQHQTTGALAVWYMRDAVMVSGDSISPATVADTNWKVRTVVDWNLDGHPDLIWQHRVSGEIAVWFMNDRTLQSGEFLGPGRVADTNWTIVGAGDGNGDGSPDLYWHHLGTGQLAIWFMRGVHMLGGESISPASVADTNWRVRGIADLDRNGSADLIWQNVATSELAVWLLNGLRLVDGHHITGPAMPAASWVLVGPR